MAMIIIMIMVQLRPWSTKPLFCGHSVCTGHSPLLALLDRGEKQIAELPALGSASRPVLLGLLWKGNNFIRNDIFLAGWPSADRSAPGALVISAADGVHVAISRDPEQEAKPAKCKSLRGSKPCYFRVVCFFFLEFSLTTYLKSQPS